MKKLSVTLLIFTLVFGHLLQPNTAQASGDSVSNKVNSKAMIQVLETYIDSNNGQIIVGSIPESVYEEFGHENIEAMIKGIEELNEQAIRNEIIITENETIYDINDSGFVLQGGVTKSVKKWYGWAEYMSTATANSFVYQMSKAGIVAGAAGVIAGAFSFGTTAIIGGLSSAYFANLALDIANRNSGHSRGIIFHLTHAAVYWTEKQ